MVDRRQFVSVASFQRLRDDLRTEIAALRAQLRNGVQSSARGGFGIQRIENRKAIPCKQCQEHEVVRLDADIGPATYNAAGMCYAEGQAIALEHNTATNCYEDTRPTNGRCRRIEVASQFRCGTYYAGEIVTVMRRRPCEPFLIQSRPCMTYTGRFEEEPGSWTIETTDGPRTITIPGTPDDVEVGQLRQLTLNCNCRWIVGCCEIEEDCSECLGDCFADCCQEFVSRMRLSVDADVSFTGTGGAWDGCCDAIMQTMSHDGIGVSGPLGGPLSEVEIDCDSDGTWIGRITKNEVAQCTDDNGNTRQVVAIVSVVAVFNCSGVSPSISLQANWQFLFQSEGAPGTFITVFAGGLDTSTGLADLDADGDCPGRFTTTINPEFPQPDAVVNLPSCGFTVNSITLGFSLV